MKEPESYYIAVWVIYCVLEAGYKNKGLDFIHEETGESISVMEITKEIWHLADGQPFIRSWVP